MSDNATIASPKTSSHAASKAVPVTLATDIAMLLIKRRDQAGIVQAVSEFIHRYGANIITLDQYSTAHESGQYFMRLEFALRGLGEILDNLLVLARYMQVLSSDFVRRLPMQIINIHHWFLPPFVSNTLIIKA